MGEITWLVDISHWQGGIDIARIAREGYRACLCKATEGTTFVDDRFDGYIPKAKAAGMIPGAYHFLRDGDGAAQARHFHKRITKHGGPAGWLIGLDCESDGHGPEITAWAREWKRLTGSHPFLIYSGAWWWPRTNNFRGADLTPYLWHSRYVSGTGYGSVLYEKVPASWWKPGYGGWPQATILQFSSKGQVAGKQIDVNAFRGSLAQLKTLTRAPATATPAKPAATPASWTKEIIVELPVLRTGATGAQVQITQAACNARGQNLTVDGVFGPKTEAAVKAEQQQAGIGVDGVIGQATYAVLLLGRNIF